MLHISDLNNSRHCRRMYQLSRIQEVKPVEYRFSYFNMMVSPAESLQRCLGFSVFFEGETGQDNTVSFAAMEKYDWLRNVRFEYREFRVKASLMHRNEDGWDLYFLSYSPIPTSELGANYAVTVQILEKLGIRIKNYYLIRLNMNYYRGKELDDHNVWIISERFSNAKGNPSRYLREVIDEKRIDIDAMIDGLEQLEKEPVEPAKRCSYCNKRVPCRFFEECFPEYASIPDNSILYLSGCAKKDEMFREGRLYLKDADIQRIEGGQLQYSQIMADQSGGSFYDELGIRGWMQTVKSDPAIFLDFEWDLYLLPPYEGMHPLEPLLTQYSVHILDHGKVTHKEYLGSGDCRRDLAEHLIQDIPSKGRLYAFNAVGAEIIRIRELAELFDDLYEPLHDLELRMVDLALPFAAGMYYDVRMKGTYSLKTLSRLIDPEHSYSDLDVSQGLEAVDVHRKYAVCEDPELKAKMAKELKEYCAMDTLELLKLYQWLLTL